MLDVKLKYLSDRISRPEYATRGSIGFDLSADLDVPFVLKSGDKAVIPSGIAISIPEGYGGFIIGRGGISVKKGIVISCGTGIIDSDYTGEIKIPLMNISDCNYTIKPGDKIAQVVVIPVEKVNFIAVDELPETDRGVKGFGSTGK